MEQQSPGVVSCGFYRMSFAPEEHHFKFLQMILCSLLFAPVRPPHLDSLPVLNCHFTALGQTDRSQSRRI